MRVYEYAKKVGSSSKEILKYLADAGVELANHMAILANEELEYLDEKFVINDKKNRNAPVQAGQEEVEGIPTVEEIPVIQEQKIDELILEPMIVADLAERLVKPSSEIILLLLRWGIAAPKNYLLDEQIISRIAQHFQIPTKQPVRQVEHKRLTPHQPISVTQEQTSRSPVIVVLGHVDHGKTTLLDFIRKTRVAAREKGGITQHLGAYHVNTKHGGIVFLDTPGHEAFSKIRSRGLKVADLAILVVAADDGIMPQTVEAIRFAKEMNVPIIAAINKIDKVAPARLEVVKRQLAEQDLLPEEWGGQTVIVPISAKAGTGVDSLLEMIDLQAQLLELKTDPSVSAAGYVLESKIEKGRGPVATVLLQQGTLSIGDYFIAGEITGKVSSLLDSYGKFLKSVGASHPVQVATFDALPNAGDLFEVAEKDQLRTKMKMQQIKFVPKMISKEKAINVIIKTDTNSSREALEDSIKKLAKKIDHIDFNLVASGVGDISERDVLFAANTHSAIIGLHVKIASGAAQIAQQEGVSITLFDIIYKLLEDLEQRAAQLKEIKMIDKKVGEGVIRKVFDIKKIGIIAGSYVKEGIFSKNGKVVVWRGKYKIGSASITSLQREGKNIKEVHAGFECAFMADGLTDFAVDDRIECYVSVPESRS